MVRTETRDTLNSLCCIGPIILSVLALTLVVQGVLLYGAHPPAGEGLHAGLFQLLMAVQVPLIALFAGTADWRGKRERSRRILAAQIGGIVLAAGAVGIWEWARLAAM